MSNFKTVEQKTISFIKVFYQLVFNLPKGSKKCKYENHKNKTIT